MSFENQAYIYQYQYYMENLDTSDVNQEDLLSLSHAIKEYQGAIDKCKSQITLSNYHKHYKKKVKTRCAVMCEHSLAQSQQLIRPGIGTDHNFNIYTFLSKKAKIKKILLPIIDTLIFIGSTNETIYIRNDVKGFIIQTKGDEAFSEFYHKLETSRYFGQPLCIYKPSDSKNMLFDNLLSLYDHLGETPHHDCIIQRFVCNTNDHMSMLRVHWKQNSKLKAYLIGNKKKIYSSNTSNLKSRTQSTTKFLQSTEASSQNAQKIVQSDEALLSHAHKIIEMHKISRFRRFSVITLTHEDAFSPLDEMYCSIENETFKSVTPVNSLADNISSKCYKPWNSKYEGDIYAVQEELAQKYLITGRNPKNSYVISLRQIDKDLEKIVAEIVSMFNCDFGKGKKKISEITLDFMRDGKQWVLIKCDKLLIDEDQTTFNEVMNTNTKHMLNSFISLNNGNMHGVFSLPINILPSKREETPLLHKRTITNVGKIRPIKKVATKARNTMQNLEETFTKIIDKIPENDAIKFDHVKSNIIDNYELCYPSYAMGQKLLNEKRRKSYVKSFQLLKEEPVKSVDLKPIIKEYNSMMIHVRRVNLKNKKPLVEHYGGEVFWKRIIKRFYDKLLTYELVGKYLVKHTKSSFDGMFCKGLNMIFNSEISLDFRRLVRQKHKNLNVGEDIFKLFCRSFLSVLRENNVEEQDIEIIQDNLSSFAKAIVCNKKKTGSEKSSG